MLRLEIRANIARNRSRRALMKERLELMCRLRQRMRLQLIQAVISAKRIPAKTIPLVSVKAATGVAQR